MNVNDLVRIYESATAGEVAMDDVGKLRDFLIVTSKSAKKILLERINEGDFVKVRTLIKRAVIAVMISENVGGAAMLQVVDMTKADALNGLLDTCVLAMVGLMIQDEIV
jgi:hypothetical protein